MSDFVARSLAVGSGLAALGASLLAGSAAAWAQSGGAAIPSISQPVVQAVPGSTGMKLNEVLYRLSRNPTDVPTLIEAGKISMQLGDPAAAVGFYQRAARLAPANPNVQAGLAGAVALNDDPVTAIDLFNRAEQAGPIDPALLAPRGLAYDLVGDNQTAQRYYQQALSVGDDDETVRRLAISQAIGGDRRAMELTLTPLLQKQDKGAWRSRAFALAILGQGAEAESIVRSTMPAQLAEPMSAYLRYMPRLTAAQQAAAANLGHFPRAADIGREDPRFAQFQRPRVAPPAAAAPVLAAAARPGDRTSTRASRRSRDAEARAAAAAAVPKPAPAVRVAAAAPRSTIASTAAAAPPVAPQASRQTTATPTVTTAPPPPVAVKPPVMAAAPRPVTPAAAPVTPAPVAAAPVTPAPVTPAPAVAASTSAATPAPGFASLDSGGPAVRGFELKPSTPAAPAAAPTPAPAPAPAPAARPRSLADVFADLGPPSREAEPVAGAVDVRRIAPAVDPKVKAAADAKARAEREAKAAKLAEDREKAIKASAAARHPSRIWVQVATGRDKSALGFDWRRFNRENSEVFGKRSPFVTGWGQTNRLLTGPFPSDKAATTFIAQLKKAGIDGAFTWTSPAGQIVDALGSGR
ncbi:SPOR domain-containing protein [Novosphingobium sp.]|uniref:SPOR domain-containing protein n=1 Tax=Novosphingobium sp. TaxID=1874826 RepID=UPI00273389DA|nr:SPOR domain-containing protein [Novosphingobium sp.]MDP3905763.1 SPOR domain-containing protein [Novosphingobium sp.]